MPPRLPSAGGSPRRRGTGSRTPAPRATSPSRPATPASSATTAGCGTSPAARPSRRRRTTLPRGTGRRPPRRWRHDQRRRHGPSGRGGGDLRRRAGRSARRQADAWRPNPVHRSRRCGEARGDRCEQAVDGRHHRHAQPPAQVRARAVREPRARAPRGRLPDARRGARAVRGPRRPERGDRRRQLCPGEGSGRGRGGLGAAHRHPGHPPARRGDRRRPAQRGDRHPADVRRGRDLVRATDKVPPATLEELGVSRNLASTGQRLAAAPAAVNEYLASAREPSVAGALRAADEALAEAIFASRDRAIGPERRAIEEAARRRRVWSGHKAKLATMLLLTRPTTSRSMTGTRRCRACCGRPAPGSTQ